MAPSRRPRTGKRWQARVLDAFCLLVLAFLMLPILIVIPISFTASDYIDFPPKALSLRWYMAYFTDEEWLRATVFSFKIAAITAVVATLVGVAAAFALVRTGLARKDFVNAAIAAPMIVPAIISAVGLYLFLSRAGLVGTTTGFVLAHTVLVLPLVVFTVIAGLEAADPRLEAAALSLGASRFMTIARITLPLALPGVLIGAAFAFISSFDEATVSFFVSTSSGKTLPKKMFEGIEWELSPVIAVVSTLLTLASLALVVSITVVRERRRRGSASTDAGPSSL